MCSVRALQDWCRDVCEGYSDVQITDMSSSFTDGLAFCAIIHKHRPEILDFHSLSKHNVYENMRLAFVVAERELGIPALLDPDELMCVEEPDLLSIITYVSQLYCVFNGKPLDSQKIPVNAELSSTRRQEQTHTQFSSDVIRSSDKSVCSVCHTRVHLIQRVLVKGHLYHRSCFRCSRCRRSLLPMSFTEDSETGLLQCSYHCKPVPEHDRPAERDRSETNRDRSETDRDRSETDGDRSETDGDRSETDRGRSETDGDRSETDGDRSETDRDRSETNRDRSETDGDRSETDRERSETDGDRSETDRDVMSERPLSNSSEIDIQEPPKPAPRKRAEPQEPACPAPRSQDRHPDNVSSQRVVLKDHPWRKLVDPGPWYRLPPTPSTHSRRCPATFNPFLEDDEDESKDEEQHPLSFKTSVANKPQASSSDPSMHQAAASAHGFPLIKRKVSTDTLVSEKEVCEEQKELEERLLKLEKRGVQLEREMRRRTDENLLVDWFILIHKKNMLVRRDAELVYMLRQHRLEQQQIDVEFELRCLFNKPEQDWSSDDRQREHQLMSHLLSIIQQRNDIISSLDLDRQREEEEDMMLSAVIQRTDLLTQTDKQLDKFNRDVIIQQFVSLTSVEGRDERFLAFKPMKDRLDVFLYTTLSTPYPDLLQFCKSLLLLSHGQATVERGFSINKEVETCNLQDRTLESLRLVCDRISSCGGVLKVPLTKELLASASSARSQYRLYLENERKNKESAAHALKRKAVEEELLDLRTQHEVLSRVCESLENDADKLAEQAEGKAGSKMAEFIIKSNTLRRRQKEKKEEPIGG